MAWGITIRKAHGLTLDKIMINIGNKERKGLNFIANSCVKSIERLHIDPTFTLRDTPDLATTNTLLGVVAKRRVWNNSSPCQMPSLPTHSPTYKKGFKPIIVTFSPTYIPSSFQAFLTSILQKHTK